MIEQLAPFAFVREFTKNGRMLVICGKEYEAYYYDTYIFTAIKIAKRWKNHQITWQRIFHLRSWIRENIQHAHNMDTGQLRSMSSVKKWIDQLIRMEYRGEEWKETREHDLKQNAEIFSPAART